MRSSALTPAPPPPPAAARVNTVVSPGCRTRTSTSGARCAAYRANACGHSPHFALKSGGSHGG